MKLSLQILHENVTQWCRIDQEKSFGLEYDCIEKLKLIQLVFSFVKLGYEIFQPFEPMWSPFSKQCQIQSTYERYTRRDCLYTVNDLALSA